MSAAEQQRLHVIKRILEIESDIARLETALMSVVDILDDLVWDGVSSEEKMIPLRKIAQAIDREHAEP